MYACTALINDDLEELHLRGEIVDFRDDFRVINRKSGLSATI